MERYGEKTISYAAAKTAYYEALRPAIPDESDLENNEDRVDWQHSEAFHTRSAFAKVEAEKGFGLLTLELEIPYQRDNTNGIVSEGFRNINLGSRHPLFQYVSANDFVNITFEIAVEMWVPTNSSVSKNAEIVPKFFLDLSLGDHFTLQSILGYSWQFGGGPREGRPKPRIWSCSRVDDSAKGIAVTGNPAVDPTRRIERRNGA